jgi:hypothetical protein
MWSEAMTGGWVEVIPYDDRPPRRYRIARKPSLERIERICGSGLPSGVRGGLEIVPWPTVEHDGEHWQAVAFANSDLQVVIGEGRAVVFNRNASVRLWGGGPRGRGPEEELLKRSNELNGHIVVAFGPPDFVATLGWPGT